MFNGELNSLVGYGVCFFFQAEDGIRDLVRSRGLGDVYKRQLIDEALDDITRGLLAAHTPDVVAITAPFPGNVYGLSLIHI